MDLFISLVVRGGLYMNEFICEAEHNLHERLFKDFHLHCETNFT